LRAVAELREAGIRNFNLDLMYALPEQTIEEAVADVRQACALEPTHISYYQLTLEPGTVFYSQPPPLPDDEAAWRIQSEGQSLLAAAGYAQYEVSAYARAGFRCRHNLNYWLFGDYLGLGAGAHGKLTLELPERVLRTAKPKQPREFQAAAGASAPAGERRFVAPADLPFEFMLGALRLNEGFSNQCFQSRTGLPAAAYQRVMEESGRRGLVERTAAGWMPTSVGRLFLNDLQAAFLA
jgi:oxygen-independent coproporphyrinogen-3 oxidase